MKHYRIVEHSYIGVKWWTVERKILWFWVNCFPPSEYDFYFDPGYFESYEAAKEKLQKLIDNGGKYDDFETQRVVKTVDL